jgi:hypothetical protein
MWRWCEITFAGSQHHAKQTYQEELREWLSRYEIAFDERYVWD